MTVLNVLWTGGGRKGDVHQGEVSKAQSDALDRIWQSVKDFVDDTSEVKEKVPRAPSMGSWGTKLGDVRVSYHGEIVEKAQALTSEQVLPGLPPAGYGASVPLIELCDGELREKLMNPRQNLLEEVEMPADLRLPRVHAHKEEWHKIAAELWKRGLVEPVKRPAEVRGQRVLNGAFGVVKQGKFLQDDF